MGTSAPSSRPTAPPRPRAPSCKPRTSPSRSSPTPSPGSSATPAMAASFSPGTSPPRAPSCKPPTSLSRPLPVTSQKKRHRRRRPGHHRHFGDLVVADPLHRRYVQIPSIPGDLVPTRRHHEDKMKFEPFLALACKDDEGLSFRVIYNVMSEYKVVTLVFSSVTEEWRHATSNSFLPHRLIHDPTKLVRHCSRSCFYWAYRGNSTTYDNNMLVLDPLEMKFSVVAFLDKSVGDRLAIVDAGEDRLGILAFSNCYLKLDLYCKTWRNNVVCREDWQHYKTIPLPEHSCTWEICSVGTPEGYLLMRACPKFRLHPKELYFTLDLKTLLFERMYEPGHYVDFEPGHHVDFDLLYASFPPPLSPPSI
ncbi:unnamed protein product [Urochloa decumbens]|uniref:F-box protein n=1 Tax=Urochloa decumbens TaxID=240449 RepID=A0ABC8W944_9POAL